MTIKIYIKILKVRKFLNFHFLITLPYKKAMLLFNNKGKK